MRRGCAALAFGQPFEAFERRLQKLAANEDWRPDLITSQASPPTGT